MKLVTIFFLYFFIFFCLFIYLFIFFLNMAFALCGYLLNVFVPFFLLFFFFALTTVKRKDVLCFVVFQEVVPRTSRKRGLYQRWWFRQGPEGPCQRCVQEYRLEYQRTRPQGCTRRCEPIQMDLGVQFVRISRTIDTIRSDQPMLATMLEGVTTEKSVQLSLRVFFPIPPPHPSPS